MAFKKVGHDSIDRVAVSFLLTLTEPGTVPHLVPAVMHTGSNI
jgi:hypothetical protein